MLKLSLPDVAGYIMGITGNSNTMFSLADLEHMESIRGFLNGSIDAKTCWIGLAYEQAGLPPDILEALEDLDFATIERGVPTLTETGHTVLRIWKAHFKATYEIDCEVMKAAYDRVQHESFYRSGPANYEYVAALMQNSRASVERFIHRLQHGSTINHATRELLNYPQSFTKQVCHSELVDGRVRFVQEMQPTYDTMQGLRVMIAHHGLEL